MSESNPALVKPIIDNPDFKECLYSKMTGSSAGIVLKNLATAYPADFVDWVDDLVDALKANDSIGWVVYGVFGQIGKFTFHKSLNQQEWSMRPKPRESVTSSSRSSLLILISNLLAKP